MPPGLVIRTVLKMDQAVRPNGNASGTMNATYWSLLNKAYTMFQALYQSSGTMAGTFCTDVPDESWYGFWHGEILRSLALLYQWGSSSNIAQTAMANQALAWINGMISFVNTNSVNVNLAAQLQVVTDGEGNYYSPIQRYVGGQFFEDVTDLNGAISVYANGVLKALGTDYTIGGPGLAIPGSSFLGMYIQWNSPPTAPVTAQFNYYFRVRFETDQQDFEQFMDELYTIGGSESKNGSGTLKLVTARPAIA